MSSLMFAIPPPTDDKKSGIEKTPVEKPIAALRTSPIVSTTITFILLIASPITVMYGRSKIRLYSWAAVMNSVWKPLTIYRIATITAAGAAIFTLALNLSDILHSCVLVAAIVVSEIKERLSPKKEPPTTIAVRNGVESEVSAAIPLAIGARATMVPTLVPIDMDIKQEARNSPANRKLEGKINSALYGSNLFGCCGKSAG